MNSEAMAMEREMEMVQNTEKKIHKTQYNLNIFCCKQN